jgi:hypothetical protein
MREGEMSADRRQVLSTAVRQFFTPPVLTFLALALAVSAFGYGSKLNQYRHLFELNRPCAVRMWVEHREDSFPALAHHSLRTQKLPGVQDFAASLRFARRAGWSRDLALAPSVPLRAAFLVPSLVPFRAPPISQSSLA